MLTVGFQVLAAKVTPIDTVNYSSVTVTRTVTVLPRSLTITVNDARRVYGLTNPGFTVRYAGFVNGEDPSVLSGALAFNTPATAASPVGTYPITIVPG